MHAHAPRSPGRGLQVADIFREHGDEVRRRYALTRAQQRVLRDVQDCRTAALGGHVDVCSHCGYTRPAYNSCRNRHCPTCQAAQQAAWIEARRERVLPVHHFHVVFTLPSQLRRLLPVNARFLYDLLFRAASETLLQLGEDRLGGQVGITAVLHTWTRDLRLHPHVHCVVTGGALTQGPEPSWNAARPRFLFPLAVMRCLFKAKVIAGLEEGRRRGRLRLPEDLVPPHGWDAMVLHLQRLKWVVYCKRPFGGPDQVFQYLGRYTHRVAISSARLRHVGPDEVVFRTRGEHTASLHPHTFILRFLQHTLPPRFRKIRHYGLLSPVGIRERHAKARAALARLAETEHSAPLEGSVPDLVKDELSVFDELRRCPHCDVGRLLRFPLHLVPSWLLASPPLDSS